MFNIIWTTPFTGLLPFTDTCSLRHPAFKRLWEWGLIYQTKKADIFFLWEAALMKQHPFKWKQKLEVACLSLSDKEYHPLIARCINHSLYWFNLPLENWPDDNISGEFATVSFFFCLFFLSSLSLHWAINLTFQKLSERIPRCYLYLEEMFQL